MWSGLELQDHEYLSIVGLIGGSEMNYFSADNYTSKC